MFFFFNNCIYYIEWEFIFYSGFFFIFLFFIYKLYSYVAFNYYFENSVNHKKKNNIISFFFQSFYICFCCVLCLPGKPCHMLWPEETTSKDYYDNYSNPRNPNHEDKGKRAATYWLRGDLTRIELRPPLDSQVSNLLIGKGGDN